MSDITDALKVGVEEIKRLRKENEIMRAKVEVMNSFFSVVGAVRPTMDFTNQYGAVQHDPLDFMEKSLEIMRKVDKVSDRLTPKQAGALGGAAGMTKLAQEAYEKQMSAMNQQNQSMQTATVGSVEQYPDEFP